MNTKQYGEQLYQKCFKLQQKLYDQIDKLEYYTNIVKTAKPKGADIFNLKSYKAKIKSILDKIDAYSTELKSIAYYVDVKLSVLEKEMKKPTATKKSLAEIGNSFYTTETTIEMPKQLQEKLEKFNIILDDTKINLVTSVIDNEEELDM